MKFLLITLELIMVVVYAKALRCWTCNNARGAGVCSRSGRWRDCPSNEGSCQTEVRRDSGGLRITKGCKQTAACLNDMQNANCVTPLMDSVCRCCCSFDDCNRAQTSCPQRRFNDQPKRRRQQCKPIPEPEFGEKRCSKTPETSIGSRCRFSCSQGYKLVGSKTSVCVYQQRSKSARFNREAPMCVAQQCKRQTLEHGQVTCSDGNAIASHCVFSCDVNYDLFPQGFEGNTCQTDLYWSIPTPCCTRECPKYVLVDLVIALDSSSSIGGENWKVMRDFVFNLTEKFTIGRDSAQISVFRYNKFVDVDSQVLLNSADEADEFQRAFDQLNYDGTGTMLGQALRHVSREILQEANGDRRNAPDVLLIISDGGSQDDVINPSRELHDQHVLTYALGINSTHGTLNREQLLEVVGSADRYLEARHGFDDLDLSFVEKLSNKLCEFRCQQRFRDEI